jgi:hypothetical protein
MRLQIITTYFNPIGYKNRLLRYLEFERHMLESNVDLTVVECNRVGEKHVLTSTAINHIPVSASTICWQKESQFQVGLDYVFSNNSSDYIGFFDADIIFQNPHWVRDAIDILQDHDIASAWETCQDLGPDGNVAETHESFGKAIKDRRAIIQGPNVPSHVKKSIKLAHPGYAWIARREFLQATGGFITTAILGSGDHHMALSLLGRAHESAPYSVTQSYMSPIIEWQAKSLKFAPRIGYVPGNIIHGYHGSKKDRAYAERWEILVKHEFDPKTDLVFNEFGIVELAGNKPELNKDIENYFFNRKEDGNQMASAT